MLTMQRLIPIMLAILACTTLTWAASARGKGKDMLAGVQRIMFIGDSLTDGSDYPDYVVNTINHLRPKANLQRFNAAIAGNTAADLVQRMERDMLSQHPDLVSICIGTNDSNTNRPVADYARDLEYLILRFRENGAKVLLMLPSPMGDPKREEAFQPYLAVIRSLAVKHRCPLADAHGLFLQWMKEGKEMLSADGVHHGAFGFEGMARAVLIALGFADAPMVKDITPWPYLLTEWEMSAPIPQEKAPASPKNITEWTAYDRLKAVAMQPWWDAPFAARGGWMPFGLAKPTVPSVAFGRTWYDAKDDEVAEMQIGGSRLKVWLNGELVWESTDANFAGFHPNASRFPVHLKQGRNEIVVRNDYFAFVGIREMGTK